MSNSNNMAILAITKKHPIGIDLECVKLIENISDMPHQIFSSEEYFKFKSISINQKNNAFYRIWTRKEAFTKAVGQGLLYPLSSFNVTFLPYEPVKITKINNSCKQALDWSLNHFSFNYSNNEYIIAIATKSQSKQIFHFFYPTNKYIM